MEGRNEAVIYVEGLKIEVPVLEYSSTAQKWHGWSEKYMVQKSSIRLGTQQPTGPLYETSTVPVLSPYGSILALRK